MARVKVIKTEKEGIIVKMLPRLVYLMCVHGALIVGSKAKWFTGDIADPGNDYDLLVPLEKWQTIALLIPDTAKPNKFGGWRFKDEKDNEIDVWPDTLENYLRNCKTKYGGEVAAVDFINNRVFTCSFLKE
jgi:hypothetical protein